MRLQLATISLLTALSLAAPEPRAKPMRPDNLASLDDALRARGSESPVKREAEPEAKPEVFVPAVPQLESRDPKKSKPKGNKGGNSTDDSAAGIVTPSLALELGAIGLGVMEIVRLWV